MPAPSFTHLERRKIEAGVLIPVVQAFQGAIGKERANEIARAVFIELARKDGERWAQQFGKAKREEARMARTVATLLMFDGVAEEAMSFYVSLFRGSEITRIERHGPGEQGAEGSVTRANFTLGGQDLICFDSPVKHDFTFTPSISIFVDREDEAELDEAFTQLSADGEVLMPLGNYGFSAKFGWVNDRFGVSWQLNLD
jgi:predicted 3-demethylubiquinone-9 3-methyltransferase (glyoxalase superfamily)